MLERECKRRRRKTLCCVSNVGTVVLLLLLLFGGVTVSFVIVPCSRHHHSVAQSRLSTTMTTLTPTTATFQRTTTTTTELSSSLQSATDWNSLDNSTAATTSATSASVAAVVQPYASISSNNMPSQLQPQTGHQTIRILNGDLARAYNNNQNEDEAVVATVAANAGVPNDDALQHLYDTVTELQNLFGKDAIALVRGDDNASDCSVHIPSINSLVFAFRNDHPSHSNADEHPQSYVLVIVAEGQRVNVTALEQAVCRHAPCSSSSSTPTTPLSLLASDQVQRTCGFAPGTVPPTGLWPEPTWTVIDESLVRKLPLRPATTMFDDATAVATSSDASALVQGGGGRVDQSCRVAMEVLLLQQQRRRQQQRSVLVAAISEELHDKTEKKAVDGTNRPTQGIVVVNGAAADNDDAAPSIVLYPKPFFAVEPPPDDLVWQALYSTTTMVSDMDSSAQGKSVNTSSSLLQPVSLSVVGRIGGVRRMARELAFCDLDPPLPPSSSSLLHQNSNNDDNDEAVDSWPWRHPITGEPMAVQLIAGQTLCRNSGGDDDAIHNLQKGQLILVQGRTNVQSRNSLRNWMDKRSLDIFVHSYQILQTEEAAATHNLSPELLRQRKVERRRLLAPFQQQQPPVNPEHCLRLKDLYGPTSSNDDSAVDGINDGEKAAAAPHTVLVDDISSVKRFTKDLSQVLTSLHSNAPVKVSQQGDEPWGDSNRLGSTVGLVGIDCEWQPSFLLPTPRDPQPVLLLQICLHPLKRTFLFDLQTLLRPMMAPSQSMDKLEKEVSFALGALFESKRLIKVGFQIVHDLRQLAASYPHIANLQFHNAVLESSTLGKKALRITRAGENARDATSSLSRLVDQFIGKPLNKQEQCSDWSKRPLSHEQLEYASLDAAVTPIIVEKIVKDLNAQFFPDKPLLGRWNNDMSFKKTISSWRFVFVHTTDFNLQRKLKAKRVVGDPLVVSQSWTTGDVPPKLPALPENGFDGPYTDPSGVVQVPSTSVTIRSSNIGGIIDSMIGERIGKSKDKCVTAFIQRRATEMPEGAKLDYPQRSGYVEFRDGVSLFVNMPTSPGGRFQSRSYPNEWLNDGRILTWFLRENDWKHGTSDLAKKLVSRSDGVVVTLFVRLGSNGEFLFCGRCRAEQPEFIDSVNGVNGDTRTLQDASFSSSSSIAVPENWTLVKLHLILLDWSKLRSHVDFQALINPLCCIVSPESSNGSTQRDG